MRQSGVNAMKLQRPRSFLDRISCIAFRRQISYFFIFGSMTAIVHYGTLIALVELWGVNEILATTIGFAIAVLIAYWLNRNYTFQSTEAFARGMTRYCGSASIGLALNGGIMALLISHGVYYLIAQFVASGVAFFWNFLVARHFVFKCRD